MATLLQATSAFSSTLGSNKKVKFSTEPTVGSLLLVYAIRRGDFTVEPEDIQGGWTEIATMYPHIATMAPGRLFSRITDGTEYTFSSGFYLTGEFGPCETFVATEWDVPGISSATPTATTGPSSWANLGGPGTVNARQSVTSNDLAVMVFHGKTFGFNTFSAAAGSTLALLWPDANWPAIMVYKNGAGSIENGVDWSAAQDGGYQYVSAAFGPGGAGTGLDCAFSASPTTGSAPLEVTFTDETIGDPDGWLWDFGDGDTSTSQNPTHTYTEPGAYTITLTTTRSGDDDECSLEVEAFIVLREPGVFIDWDNDDFPNGAYDNVSSDVISWTINRGSGPEITSSSQPGSATVVLKNPADKYNPYNSSSPLYGLLRDGAPIWIGPNVDGTLTGDDPRGLFGGRITDITPIPAGGATDSPTVEIMAEDFLGWSQRIPVALPFDEGRSHDELREASLIFGGETHYDLAHEIHTMPLSTADGTLASILDGLNSATGTRHFAKPEDAYTQWFSYTTRNRFWRTDATSDASLSGEDDHVTETDGWRLSADTVVNRQVATVTPIQFTPGAFTVWQAETLPIELADDRSYSRIVDFDDVVRDPVLDLASTGDVVIQSFEPFATGAKIELSVAAGDEATVTQLSIEGRLARRLVAESAQADDEASQALPRGIRAGGDLSNEYIGVIATARGLAEHVVWRFGNPQLRPTLTVINWLPEQFDLDLYDVISFTSPQLKMTARLFEIVGLTHEGIHAADNGPIEHTVTYVLQECRAQTDPGWFTLDDAGSELDGDKILHY